MSRKSVAPNDIRWVSGVNKWRDKFQVQWRDRTANKKHSRTFRIESEAEAFRAACAAKIAETDPGQGSHGFMLEDFPNYEEWEAQGKSSQWWRRVYGRLVDELLRTDDLERQATIRKHITAISSAGKGARVFIDQAEIERRITEMEEALAEVSCHA